MVPDTRATPPPTLLLVGADAPGLNVVAALLTGDGNLVLRASCGTEALRMLAERPIDVLLCQASLSGADSMRSLTQADSEVPGLLLLEEHAPDSGGFHTDLPLSWTWLRGPWRDREVRRVVQEALGKRALLLERRLLLARIEQLESELNAALAQAETAAASRTEELEQTVGFLRAEEEARRRSYAATLKLCSNLVGLRDASQANLAQAVAEHALALALRLGMDAVAAQDVMFAGLLHHIGKLALPDALLNKPFERLTPAERNETARYPVIGAKLLAGIEPLQAAALHIRHQNECFDGHGLPDRQAGEGIPLGARILSVAKGYHAFQRGGVDGRRHTPDDASEFLRRNRRSRYDPAVVDVFLEVVRASTRRLLDEPVLCVSTADLAPGMVLARDVLTDDGALLLAKDYILDAGLIHRLRIVERNTQEHLTIFVRHRHAPGAPPGEGAFKEPP